MNKKKNVEKVLTELGKKIDFLIEESKQTGNKISDEMGEKINELKKKKESLEEVFKSYTSHKGETWNKVKLHVSEAIKELKEAINVIVTKKD